MDDIDDLTSQWCSRVPKSLKGLQVLPAVLVHICMRRAEGHIVTMYLCNLTAQARVRDKLSHALHQC